MSEALVEAGAPLDLVGMSSDFVTDELVHAELAARMAPFAACDPHEESYSSPPTGGELHFHYRSFSAALTTEKRTRTPDVCCYMIWEFPRRH